MITRTYDISGIHYLRENFPGVDVDAWIANPNNVAVTDGAGNYGLMDEGSDGLHTGHYFFESRGKEAVRVAKEMLDYAFKECGVKSIRGMTPLQHLGARWLSRRLGFKGYGVLQTANGPCELFILTKTEWEGAR